MDFRYDKGNYCLGLHKKPADQGGASIEQDIEGCEGAKLRANRDGYFSNEVLPIRRPLPFKVAEQNLQRGNPWDVAV